VIVLGLFRGNDGILRRRPSPYSGAKLLAGASAGEVIFYDPSGRLEEAQYNGCVSRPIENQKWEEIVGRFLSLENIFNLGIHKENDRLTICIDGHLQTLQPEHFRWIIPTGTLEGYH